MADLARPALPEVLAALTSEPHAPAWESVAQRVVAGPEDVRICALPDTYVILPARWPWTTTDPTEAAELLVTREVLPAGWHGDTRRGWHCEACKGTGNGKSRHYGNGKSRHYGTAPCEVCCPDPERPWKRTGYTMNPRTIPDLVAVASLGWPAIQRAEELARAACHALREYGCPTPERVVWRVGSRSPSDAVLWRARGLVVVSVRGVVLVGGRLDVRPDRRVVVAAEALWTSGLALDRITADAVVVVVPPVGGVR